MLGIPETIWQALIAAIVTITLAWLQRSTNQKLQRLQSVATSTHILVNNNYGVQLKIGALALRRIANMSKSVDDVFAAEVAEKSLADHITQQAIVDSNKEKEE